MDQCPCGSGTGYDACCGALIDGGKPAPSAVALMRSRYAAYVRGDVEYLVATCKDGTGIDRESTGRWSSRSTWLGLEIHGSSGGCGDDVSGEVDFSATFVMDGLREVHRERAKFEKIGGRWLYADGEVRTSTIVRQTPKTGRNDPCPCGSGRKYKKCCGTGG